MLAASQNLLAGGSEESESQSNKKSSHSDSVETCLFEDSPAYREDARHDIDEEEDDNLMLAIPETPPPPSRLNADPSLNQSQLNAENDEDNEVEDEDLLQALDSIIKRKEESFASPKVKPANCFVPETPPSPIRHSLLLQSSSNNSKQVEANDEDDDDSRTFCDELSIPSQKELPCQEHNDPDESFLIDSWASQFVITDEDFNAFSSEKVEKPDVDKATSNDDQRELEEKEDLELQLGNERWNIPKFIVERWKKVFGIMKMHPWQKTCLEQLQGESEFSNLILSAPTSSGKTLIADLVILKHLLEPRIAQGLILYVVPFVSLVTERVSALKKLLLFTYFKKDPLLKAPNKFKYPMRKLASRSGLRIAAYHGPQKPESVVPLEKADIVICTLEKANSILNRLQQPEMEKRKLDLLLVDELHLMGEPNRGVLLEVILSKVLFLNHSATIEKKATTRIVGMSATLSNMEDIAKWLNAIPFKSSARPVPLHQFFIPLPSSNRKWPLSVGIRNLENGVEKSVLVEELLYRGMKDLPGAVVAALCRESFYQSKDVASDSGILIFCPTKDGCSDLALKLSSLASHLHQPGSVVGKNGPSSSLLEKLTVAGGQCGLDPLLASCIPWKIAFHHAGLSTEEREVIEAAFKSGQLRILIATCTLASGVNLPAKQVIFTAPYIGRSLIDPLAYHQMCGRAGRQGYDTRGESFLIYRGSGREQFHIDKVILPSAKGSSAEGDVPLPPVKSQLFYQGALSKQKVPGENAFTRAVLELVVAFGVDNLAEQLELFHLFTFDYYECRGMDESAKSKKASLLKESVEYLLERKFIDKESSNNGDDRIRASKLGIATVSSSLTPIEGLMLYQELLVSLRSIVLESELHLLYLAGTPVYSNGPNALLSIQPNWERFFELYNETAADNKPNSNLANIRRVGKAVGISEAFLIDAMTNSASFKNEAALSKFKVHQRFYSALILYDLSVLGTSLPHVCDRYLVNRGVVQGLVQSAANFTHTVKLFCSSLETWKPLLAVINQFGEKQQQSMSNGTSSEFFCRLLMPIFGPVRANCMYKALREGLFLAENSDDTVMLQAMKQKSVKALADILPGSRALAFKDAKKLLSLVNNSTGRSKRALLHYRNSSSYSISQ